jgi:hypothetical protein
MFTQDPDHQQPVENIIIAFAANIQLRQSKLELEELLFLYDTIKEAISSYEREIH